MIMNVCSKCGGETISEPYDTSKPIICERCRYSCKDCGEATLGGGHNEFCNSCLSKRREAKRPGIGLMVIDKTKHKGTSMNKSNYKLLNSRVIDDDGNTLHGEKGVEFMKSKGDTYAPRLKEYYDK
jgi:hypothetical protein